MHVCNACIYVCMYVCMYIFLYVCIYVCTYVFNLQATKLFIVTSATKGGVVTTPLRFSVRFKILFRVIQRLIQHCFLHKMVYLYILYIIASRKNDFFYYRHCSVISELLCYTTVTTYVLAKKYKLQAIVSCNIVC